MIIYVLGASGSGKTTLVRPLASLLPDYVVMDWDSFMAPAAELAGCDITRHRHTWPAYRQLVRAALEAVAHAHVLLLGVCTPDELEGWPVGAWVLLDCTDAERRRRLAPRAGHDSIAESIRDAAENRSLDLPVIDTTGRTAEDVAADLAGFVRRAEHGGPTDLPTLTGPQVTIRPGGPEDVAPLRSVLADESVVRWWGEPEPAADIAAKLRGYDSSVLLVIEMGGQVAGGIQYDEEQDPMYRRASIDIFLGSNYQGRGAGAEAIALLARFLFDQRGHHRITIDPAAANQQAIRCYRKVGFRPVGMMRQYERGADGEFHDGLLMDLLRDDQALCLAWKTRRAGRERLAPDHQDQDYQPDEPGDAAQRGNPAAFDRGGLLGVRLDEFALIIRLVSYPVVARC